MYNTKPHKESKSTTKFQQFHLCKGVCSFSILLAMPFCPTLQCLRAFTILCHVGVPFSPLDRPSEAMLKSHHQEMYQDWMWMRGAWLG